MSGREVSILSFSIADDLIWKEVVSGLCVEMGVLRNGVVVVKEREVWEGVLDGKNVMGVDRMEVSIRGLR